MRQFLIVAVLSLLSVVARGAEIEDPTGRLVTIPDRVSRVMAAGPPASVVLYVLAPEKMIGWTAAPRPNEREFLLPSVRDLPELGRLTGRGDTANIEVVLKAKPDLIFDFGSVNADLCLAREPRAGADRGALPPARRPARPHRRHRAPARQGAGRARAGRPHRRAISRTTEQLLDDRLRDLPAAAAPPGLSRPRGERPRDRAHRLDQHRDHRACRRHQRRRARQRCAAASPMSRWNR